MEKDGGNWDCGAAEEAEASAVADAAAEDCKNRRRENEGVCGLMA